MKVLMTADTLGGVWQYALTLSRALAPLEVELLLATMGGPLTPEQRRQVHALSNMRLCESSYRLAWQRHAWDDVERAADWLLLLADSYRPDVVHLNDYPHGHLPWPAPVLMVGHCCVCSWWQAVKGVPAPQEWDRYRSTVRRGLAGASRVVTPTRAMLAALERHHGALPPAHVIPNARDGFVRGPKQAYILAAGRMWNEAKNLETLVRAAPGLPWPVRIAGATRHPARPRVRYANVRTLGWLDEQAMAECLAHAAIYALPARYEPFGLSILEAALSGCALVLGDIPSLRETWQGAATFVPPDDHRALHRALRRLIDEPSRLLDQADRARRRARDYTPERMAAGYAELYDTLAVERQREEAVASHAIGLETSLRPG